MRLAWSWYMETFVWLSLQSVQSGFTTYTLVQQKRKPNFCHLVILYEETKLSFTLKWIIVSYGSVDCSERRFRWSEKRVILYSKFI